MVHENSIERLMNLLDLKLDHCLWEKVFSKTKLSCVIDAGASDGPYTQLYLDHGASYVHAFEPVPWMFEKLRARFPSESRVRLNRLGLSDAEGTLENARVYNCWTLLPASERNDEIQESKERPDFSVAFTTVDAYCEQHSLHPTLIKIDVDGYEAAMLRGAMKTLQAFRPVLYVELSQLCRMIGDTPEMIADEIGRARYKLASNCGTIIAETPEEILRVYPPDASLDVILLPMEYPL